MFAFDARSDFYFAGNLVFIYPLKTADWQSKARSNKSLNFTLNFIKYLPTGRFHMKMIFTKGDLPIGRADRFSNTNYYN